MQFRDLIIMLIPIICNGFIVFLVQRHYSQRLERKLRNGTRLINTIQDFKKEIYKATVILAEFSCIRNEKDTMGSVYKLIDFFVKDFCTFYHNNKVALSPNKDIIDKLIQLINDLIAAIKRHDINLGEQHLNSIKAELNTLSEELEKRLERL